MNAIPLQQLKRSKIQPGNRSNARFESKFEKPFGAQNVEPSDNSHLFSVSRSQQFYVRKCEFQS